MDLQKIGSFESFQVSSQECNESHLVNFPQFLVSYHCNPHTIQRSLIEGKKNTGSMITLSHVLVGNNNDPLIGKALA